MTNVVNINRANNAVQKTLRIYAKDKDVDGFLMLVNRGGSVEYIMCGDHLTGFEAVHYLMRFAEELNPIEYEDEE